MKGITYGKWFDYDYLFTERQVHVTVTAGEDGIKLAMVLSLAFITGTLTNPAYAYQEKRTSPESGHTASAAASSPLLSTSSFRTSIATATVTGIKDKSLDREKNQAETQGVRQRLFS